MRDLAVTAVLTGIAVIGFLLGDHRLFSERWRRARRSGQVVIAVGCAAGVAWLFVLLHDELRH